jgi:hypothetical protein
MMQSAAGRANLVGQVEALLSGKFEVFLGRATGVRLLYEAGYVVPCIGNLTE